MKKSIVGLTVATMMLLGGASAWAGSNGSAPHLQNQSLGVAASNVEAGGIAVDFDIKGLPLDSGVAGGAGIVATDAEAGAFGVVSKGEVSVNTSVVTKNLVDSESNRLNTGDVSNKLGGASLDTAIGISNTTSSSASTEGALDITVDPYTGKKAGGFVAGGMSGEVAQATVAASKATESPIHFDTTGDTKGIAVQGSQGEFEGTAFATAGRDKQGWDNKAGASVDASIETNGITNSESFRFVSGDTEGMGTTVFANTTVETDSNIELTGSERLRGNNSHDNSFSTANIDGDFSAAGGVATTTEQNLTTTNTVGNASATAVGSYSGSGKLGSNYNGVAAGTTLTTITTAPGVEGAVISSSAGMSVSSEAGRHALTR